MNHQYLVSWDDGKYGKQRGFATRAEMELWTAAEFDDAEWRRFAAPKAWVRAPLVLS